MLELTYQNILEDGIGEQGFDGREFEKASTVKKIRTRMNNDKKSNYTGYYVIGSYRLNLPKGMALTPYAMYETIFWDADDDVIYDQAPTDGWSTVLGGLNLSILPTERLKLEYSYAMVSLTRESVEPFPSLPGPPGPEGGVMTFMYTSSVKGPSRSTSVESGESSIASVSIPPGIGNVISRAVSISSLGSSSSSGSYSIGALTSS